jgi:homoserine kinase
VLLSGGMQHLTVRVPASTSNLGPGFDCLGVALRMYNSVTIVRGRNGSRPTIVDEAAQLFFDGSGVKAFTFGYSMEQGVPRARGLGSSATVRLGVLHGLNRLAGKPLSRFAIFRLCAELEGHPDNAAPANFGGFTVAQPLHAQRFPVSKSLYFVLLIPELEIKTARARQVLPLRIPHMDAVESCANACSITAAFAAHDYGSLQHNFADHLHQPSREKVVPFLSRVIHAAEEAGALGAFLSGSGSTIAAVTLKTPREIARAMLGAAGVKARTAITTADNQGAQISSIRKSTTYPERSGAESKGFKARK